MKTDLGGEDEERKTAWRVMRQAEETGYYP